MNSEHSKHLSDETKLVLHDSVVPTRRGLDDYLDLLEIGIDDLGEQILDLGAGMNELFSKEASQHGKTVISINPKLYLNHFSKEARERYFEPLTIDSFKSLKALKRTFLGIPWQKKSVVALAQALPFDDEVFDTIVSVESVPLYLPDTDEDWEKTFREAVRVLKPEGTFYINVAVWINKKVVKRLKRILTNLDEEYGIEYNFPSLEESGEDWENIDYLIATNMVIKRKPTNSHS